MRGRVVEVEVALLDVLAVVALVAGEAEESLLEDGVAAVPQRQGEADALMAVADAGEAVFVPAIGAEARTVRTGSSPRRRRRRCSPRAPCPRRARSDTDPSDSSARGGVRISSMRLLAASLAIAPSDHQNPMVRAIQFDRVVDLVDQFRAVLGQKR